ncbi:conserved hypothetical protein [Ricinus communis]|uniref:Uncharacterized protein n=1 Tax=Ricinus communis TaxID=3988 RepID=B9RRC8_RICCO|nr:conserved hypothetical protein [Ricinus communis]
MNLTIYTTASWKQLSKAWWIKKAKVGTGQEHIGPNISVSTYIVNIIGQASLTLGSLCFLLCRISYRN